MKILITGAGGMLGSDLSKALHPFFEVVGAGWHPAPHLAGISYKTVDLSDASAVRALIETEKPGLIFHAAAMTNVDACELDRDLALKGNLHITRHVVDSANQAGALVVFFSTDYVFDGDKKGEYLETDLPSPRSIYGESKYFAETYLQDHADKYAIIRVSWLYGVQGRSFPRTILEKAPGQQRFEVVNDQTGRPTYTRDLAAIFAELLKRNPAVFEAWNKEIFHLGNQGQTSWAGFADYILKQAGYLEAVVASITSSQLARPAKRPHNSILSLKKAEERMKIRFRPWQEAFLDFLKEFNDRKKDRGAV